MPHSDNLYSAEQSDNESFSDELSPTDGYFNRAAVSAHAMVPDPSVEDTKAEAKTLIPPHLQERMGPRSSSTSAHSSSLPSHSYASAHSASFPARASYTPSSPISSRRLDDLFPRRPASINGPPPAYSASPEPSTSTSQEPSGRSYSTFPEHHLERGFLPAREPESMGHPGEEPNESTPLSPEPPRRAPYRSIIRHLLLAALILTVMTSVLTAIFGGSKTASPTKPPKDMPPPKDRPVDSTGPYCSSATYRNDVATYEFPIGADLTVLQTTHGDRGYYNVNVDVAGEIRLRRLPKDSEHGTQPYFTVDVHVSDPNLEVLKTWDREARVLKVSAPNYARLDSNGPHCVSLEITAWFPEAAEFTNLLIEGIHLTLRVFEDIKINVTGQSKFATISGQVAFPNFNSLGSRDELSTLSETPQSTSLDGSIASLTSTTQMKPPFSSRRILVETVSGSITGCYPLMDFLGISSQSGSIKVSVFPQDVLPSAPAPAELDVQTSSASIEVNVPVRDAINPAFVPPPRNYITRVHSSAGSIKGSFYIGSLSNFRSASGSIHITGMPVIQAESSEEWETSPQNEFQTHTINGAIQVEVLDPVFITLLSNIDERPEQPPHQDPYLPIGDDDPYIIIPPNIDNAFFKIDEREQSKKKPLRNLHSTHGSQSSSVYVRYPAAWEGTLHAKTVSGSISAAGHGIKIIEEKKGFACSEILARKGVDKEGKGSFVEMSDIAGSLHFLVGSRA